MILELLSKSYLGIIQRRMGLAGHVAYLRENRNAYNIWARKPGEMRFV
jgi:hypothetical protein